MGFDVADKPASRFRVSEERTSDFLFQLVKCEQRQDYKRVVYEVKIDPVAVIINMLTVYKLLTRTLYLQSYRFCNIIILKWSDTNGEAELSDMIKVHFSSQQATRISSYKCGLLCQ